MNARIDHLDPLPQNMRGLSLSRRAWSGVGVEVTEFDCAGGPVVHQLSHDHAIRLSVVLDEIGERCEPRLREDRPCPIGYLPRHMTFAPAGMEVWGYSADTRYVKDAMLSFDIARMREDWSTDFDAGCLTTPRLRFVDDPTWSLVKLLAEAVKNPDPASQLYGEGLVAAIAARLFSRPNQLDAGPKGLAPWQLRRVLEYLDASLPEPVALNELAALSGLSPWHFSRAFKASTGLAPYRWQLDARIRRAQSLLLDTRATLEQIAEATGFADAVHFGRTFRKFVGTTPGSWRQAHKN